MSFEPFRDHYQAILDEIGASGMRKEEYAIHGAQGAAITVADGASPPRRLLNFCANNYLGLASEPAVVAAASAAMERYGFGLASVRFICGTQDLHGRLERAISDFLVTDDTILYGSCFDANAALFETLLGAGDVVLSDALNHASIIDGIRLSKATRRIYDHSDMGDLRAGLAEHAGARVRLVVTDGVFSMHGDLARLPDICDLAAEHAALVVVDDSHATGVLGAAGRGSPEHFDVAASVDVITGTLGKALGGGSGGFTSGRREIIDLLRQRSRPYLFSNSVAPAIVGGALEALEIVRREPERLERLRENTRFFRDAMTKCGFQIAPGEHPIVPIMIGDEKRTVELARRLFAKGLYVVGFTYPVVPRGEARIRVQVSAAHSREDLETAVKWFKEVAAAS